MFSGDLTEGASSSVNIDINGPSASNNYDQVQVSGYGTLGGTLNVSLNGYSPTLGDSYEILALPGGYTGTFATVSLPALKSGLKFQLNYNLLDVTLTVVPVASPPTITGLSSTSGGTSGGQAIVISGTNFRGVQSVTFGGVPAEKFTVNSSTQITAIAPPHAATTNLTPAVITVVTGTGKATTKYSYIASLLPVVTGLSVGSGSVNGGNKIVINGSNFTGATSVTFNGTPATDFHVISDTQISVVVPSVFGTGTVDVLVGTFSGTSQASGCRPVHLCATARARGHQPEPARWQHRRWYARHHHRQRLHGRLRRAVWRHLRNQLHRPVGYHDCRCRAGQPVRQR